MTGKGLLIFLVFLKLSLFSQTTVDSLSNADSLIIVGNIHISGNKVTKEKIITRELEFKKGDRFTRREFEQRLENSRNNLQNRQLFNFVTIKPYDSAGYKNVNIDLIERWYVWPVPILGLADRNFNVWWETRDWSRINYGIDIKHDNFRGRMEKLHLMLQNGYDKRLIGKWEVPYINKRQNIGMIVSGGLQYNHEASFKDTLNRPIFYHFGNDLAKKYYFAEVGFSFRPGYKVTHYLNLTYNNLWYNDSLLLMNPNLTYGDNHYQYFNLYYLLKLDYRDYAPYPLKGYYFDFSVQKVGLGILSNEVNLWRAIFNFDQYFQIYKKLYFAYRLSAYYSDQKKYQPYFLSTGLGYNGFDMRGYELVVVRAQQMMMFKSNLKIEIIPMKIHRIGFIKSERFGKLFYAVYGNIFYDIGYANDLQTDHNNLLGNQLLWTVGAGMDIISFYSIVIRLEYSINKQGQTGFYVGFVAPI